MGKTFCLQILHEKYYFEILDVQNWSFKSYVARSYHKRINLTNESYVGQLINIMGPPIPGRGVPRIDVFFAGNDFYF